MAVQPAKVAITGAAGFLGTALAARLPGARLSDLETDVTRPIDAGAFEGCEVVVHLAALTGVAGSLVRPDEYWHTNVVGTECVIAAAAAAGVRRAVLVSSSSVYGECPDPAHEDRPPAPLSPYGETKVAAEAVLRAGAGVGALEGVILRPFTVYGPGQRSDMLIARLLAGERAALFGFVRDFTFVDEVVAGIVAASKALPVGAGEVVVCNLGSGRPVGAAALLDAIEEATGRRPAVEWVAGRPGEPARTEADTTRGRALLGIGEPLALVDGLRRQLAPQPVVR